MYHEFDYQLSGLDNEGAEEAVFHKTLLLRLEPLADTLDPGTVYAFIGRLSVTPRDYAILGGFRESLSEAIDAMINLTEAYSDEEDPIPFIQIEIHKSLPDVEKIMGKIRFALELDSEGSTVQ